MFAGLFGIAVSISAPVTQKSLGDQALLNELSKRSVAYFWEQSHPETGITKDRAANFKDSDDYNIGSIAAVGFALVAYPIGVERKQLDRKKALERTRLTVRNMVEKVEHQNGWSYHFIDWRTGKREWKCEASTIDTSIFLAGLIAARNYWKDPEIDKWAKKYIDRIDWKWAMTDGGNSPDETTIVHGFRPEEGFLKSRWNTFDELKMLYIQAFGASDVPTGGWSKIKREFVEYKGLEFIRGGPLFMHQMSESFYDFRNMRDSLGIDYGIETRNATLANRLYAIENPSNFKAYGANFWGLSACDGPDGYNAFGAPGWINDNGTITPTAPIASVPFTPKESKDFANSLYKNYPQCWGRYGFPNGVNPHRDWQGPDVIGIDLGMMLCGIENARNGFVWKLSGKDAIVKRGFQRAGFRKNSANDPRTLRLR